MEGKQGLVLGDWKFMYKESRPLIRRIMVVCYICTRSVDCF